MRHIRCSRRFFWLPTSEDGHRATYEWRKRVLLIKYMLAIMRASLGQGCTDCFTYQETSCTRSLHSPRRRQLWPKTHRKWRERQLHLNRTEANRIAYRGACRRVISLSMRFELYIWVDWWLRRAVVWNNYGRQSMVYYIQLLPQLYIHPVGHKPYLTTSSPRSSTSSSRHICLLVSSALIRFSCLPSFLSYRRFNLCLSRRLNGCWHACLTRLQGWMWCRLEWLSRLRQQ